MATVLFLVGRPGSGKSRIGRGIAKLERLLDGRAVILLKDYKFLFQMFQEEQKAPDSPIRRFASSKYAGFEVLDFTVLHEALKRLNDEIIPQIDEQMLILIEFARNHYQEEIWKVFDRRILDHAYFLYLQAKLDLCIERVHKRAESENRKEDDNFVPDQIMTNYYRDDRSTDLQKLFGTERVRVIDNNGEWSKTWTEVKRFVFEISIKTAVPVEELVGLH